MNKAFLFAFLLMLGAIANSVCVIPDSSGMSISSDTIFCSGTYNLSGSISFASNVTLTCNNTTIGRDITQTSYFSGFIFNNVYNATVIGCNYEGYGDNQITAFVPSGATNISIINCSVYNVSRGIEGSGNTNLLILGTNISYANLSGIQNSYSDGITIRNVNLTHIGWNLPPSQLDSDGLGVRLVNCNNSLAENSYVDNVTHSGMTYYNCWNSVFRNITVVNSRSRPFYAIFNSYNITIENCTVRNYGEPVDLSGGASGLVIRGNLFDNRNASLGSSSAFSISNVSNAILYDNVIYNASSGMNFQNNLSSNISIYNNYFDTTSRIGSYGSTASWNTTKDCTHRNIIGGNCTGGNFWRLYNGYDPNGEGIGTPAYQVDSSASVFDYLPLTNVTSACTDMDGDGFNMSYGTNASICGSQILDCNDNDASVRPPTNGESLTSSVTFCNGTYSLPNGVTVLAQNVTLACNGTSLVGDNTTGYYGIFTNQFNITIKNCQISNFFMGIDYQGATDGLIQNNTVIGTYDGGNAIVIESNSHRNSLLQNTITTGNSSGITIWGGQNTTIDCNGASIVGGNYSGTDGIYSDQPNTTIKNCNISNFSIGIYLSGATDSLIYNSTIRTTRDGTSGGAGISLGGAASDRTNMTKNTITNGNASGITMWAGNNITIDCQGAQMTGGNATSTFGIFTMNNNGINGTIVRNCNISNFGGGISFGNNRFSSISDTSASSTLNDSNFGNTIFISGEFNSITNSMGNSSGGSGLYVGSANNTIITNFTGYAQYGNTGGIKIAIHVSHTTIINSHGYSIYGPATADGIYISSGGDLNTTSHNNSVINSTGTSINGIGITSQNRNENNTILNSIGTSTNSYGIKIMINSNTRVINSTGLSNASYGIQISGNGNGSNNVTVVNCTARSNSSYAMHISTTTNSSITHNTFGNSPQALLVQDASGLNISENTFANLSSGSIIFSNVSNSVIANNSFLNASSSTGNITTTGDYYSDGIFLNVSGRECNPIYGPPVPITLWIFGTVGVDGASSASYMTNKKIECSDSGGNPYPCLLNSSHNFSIACMDLTGLTSDNSSLFFDSTKYPFTSCQNITDYFNATFGFPFSCYSFAKDILLSNGVNQNYTYNSSATFETPATFIGGVLPRLDYANTTTASGNFSVYLTGASANNNITSNTFNSALGVYFNGAVNTTVWWNYFNGSSYYAVDISGTNNSFNTSVNGQQEGNIWADVINGSVAITGTTPSNYGSAYFIGSTGSGYPYGSTTSSKVFGMTDYAPLTPFATPAVPPAGGGSNYLVPSLAYSFNCSSGALAVTAKTSGSPISGLAVRLKDPSQTGYLASAATDSSGIAAFAINESKRYSLESAQTGSYSAAYHEPFTLTLCQSAPSLPSNETPTVPAQPVPPTQPQAPASTGQTNKTTPEIPSTTSQGGTGAQNGAQNQFVPTIPGLPPVAQEAIPPALGLLVIGGAAIMLAGGIIYYFAKRRKRKK